MSRLKQSIPARVGELSTFDICSERYTKQIGSRLIDIFGFVKNNVFYYLDQNIKLIKFPNSMSIHKLRYTHH